VPGEDFSDAMLVVLGHGSTKNADSAAPVYQHAAELRRRGMFSGVREAFWKQEPKIKDVLAALATAPRVFIVPLFISEGYFASDVIPRELGFPGGHSSIEIAGSKRLWCRSVGTHDRMTAVVLGRARGVLEQFPFPRLAKTRETTLIIAGHGTEENENSRRSIERQVELIRAGGEFADVRPAYLEEEPRIAECCGGVVTRNIVVVPFFISDGMHTREDIPILLGEPERVVRERLAAGQPTWRNPTERKGKLIWYASAVGTDPAMAEVIVERVKDATG
jgi:sirohydrochlorin cobaltochelatase